jgi:hypothetical protein
MEGGGCATPQPAAPSAKGYGGSGGAGGAEPPARALLLFRVALHLSAWFDSWQQNAGARLAHVSGALSSFGKAPGASKRGVIHEAPSWLNGGAPRPRGAAGWRRELGLLLEGRVVRQGMCALILVDSAVVFVECVLDAVTDGADGAAAAEAAVGGSGGGDGGAASAAPGLSVRLALLLLHVLRGVNGLFLLVFVAELGALVLAFGLRFFRHPLYLFDAMCVSLTVCADFYVPSMGPRGRHAFELLLRVWRVLRVAHGVYATMAARAQLAAEELTAAREEAMILRNRLRRMEDALAEADPELYGRRVETLDFGSPQGQLWGGGGGGGGAAAGKAKWG